MEFMTVVPPCGLYQEFYDPAPELLLNPQKILENPNFLDANSLFWAEILSESTIDDVAQRAYKRFANDEQAPLQYRVAAWAPETFAERVRMARVKAADQNIRSQQFFSCVETLNIYCSIYSHLVGEYPYLFTVQSGWHLPEDSSKEIFQTCLDDECNPYLSFLTSTILPIVERAAPKIVFLSGRPGYFSFALARLIKQLDPTIFFCVTRHSSEYYSMNKIDFLLTQNTCLFRAIDAVILEHFEETELELINAVLNRRPVQNVRNLIVLSPDGSICHTGYHVPAVNSHVPYIQRRSKGQETGLCLHPSDTVNVHLFPNVKCYWNRCNFCGINQKYHFENPCEAYSGIEQQLSFIKETISGSTHIWFIDEALPPETLRRIAMFFLAEMPDIIWQARCRIEQELLAEGLPELLAAAGLRELRLGLESGSYAVLRNMNKFDSSFSFSLVDAICQRYSACGISIHFPIIIGFPGEHDADRQATYDLLRSLVRKYPGVTFNVNLFGLDIGSRVFRNWYNFEIQSLSFPCDPSFYLGNILQWHNTTVDMSVLARQRDQFMRELLYPWMPAHALTPPHILYRLSETKRNTLYWKELAFQATKAGQPLQQRLRIGDLTIFYSKSKELFYIYNWDSHHYMVGNQFLVKLLYMFRASSIIGGTLDQFLQTSPHSYTVDELRPLLERLIRDRYLVFVE